MVRFSLLVVSIFCFYLIFPYKSQAICSWDDFGWFKCNDHIPTCQELSGQGTETCGAGSGCGPTGCFNCASQEIAREEEVLPLGTIALMVRSGTIVPVVNNFPLTNKPIVFIVGLNDTDK